MYIRSEEAYGGLRRAARPQRHPITSARTTLAVTSMLTRDGVRFHSLLPGREYFTCSSIRMHVIRGSAGPNAMSE